MKTTPVLAAFAALIVTGCGDSRSDSNRNALNERRKAEVQALRDAAMAQAECPAPDAELDPVLEDMAKQIEKDFEAAQAAVNEAKAHGGSGSCSIAQSVNAISGNEQIDSTLTKNYRVTNPDGSGWNAVVEKRNGVVTKAERKEVQSSSSSAQTTDSE